MTLCFSVVGKPTGSYPLGMIEVTTTSESSLAMSLFAERTKSLMLEKGMSIAELARQAKMTRPGLSALLHGRGGNCTLQTAERIADALGTKLHELLTP